MGIQYSGVRFECYYCTGLRGRHKKNSRPHVSRGHEVPRAPSHFFLIPFFVEKPPKGLWELVEWPWTCLDPVEPSSNRTVHAISHNNTRSSSLVHISSQYDLQRISVAILTVINCVVEQRERRPAYSDWCLTGCACVVSCMQWAGTKKSVKCQFSFFWRGYHEVMRVRGSDGAKRGFSGGTKKKVMRSVTADRIL